MTVIDLAAKILAESSSPMHYRELARKMVESGLWKTEGRTPEQTVNARLAVDIKKNGDRSRFVRVAPGVYSTR